MWVGLDRFGQILVDAALATTILLSLVILLMLLCQQPARRIVLAQASIILALLMFPLIAVNPLPRLNKPAWLSSLVPGVSRTGSASSETSSFPGKSPHDPVTRGRSTTGLAGEGSWWKGRGPLRALTLAYMTGVSAAMFWTLLGFWGIERLVGKSVEPSPAASAIYDELSQQMDERSPFPGLRVSSRINRPVLVGVFQSFILIPPTYDEPGFDKESLKIILLHELAHASVGDTYFSAAASLAQSLWFFLPFLWWVRAQLRIDQEFLADQKVVMITGSPAGYATRLVALATPRMKPDSAWTTEKPLTFRSGKWANSGLHSPLLQRVLMLLHCPYPLELRPPRWWALSAPLLVLGLCILSVCMSLALLVHPPQSAGLSFVTSAPNRFQVNQFVAPPGITTPRGLSPFYTLPLLLPPQFELDVEVYATRAALSRIRLAGLSLGLPQPAGDDADGRMESTSPMASWHRIHIGRQPDGVSLTVDGKSIPVDRDSENLSQWLTIEPAADETASLRNLLVTW